VRATDRKPSVFEIERAISAAYSCENQLQEAGDRLSFILKVDENRDGVDIVVGSHHLGDTIARDIVKELGGKYTTHPKLVGEKDGKQLYRVNYSIRLPRYQKGDIILVDRRYYEVRSMDSHGLKAFDLTEGVHKVLREDTVGRLIGNVRDTKDALIAYIHNDIAGILDPDTFETVEIIAYAWLSLTEGEQVRVLKDTEAEKLILIG
jgi:nonsense-mediated mRNA decay protein 3